MGDESNREACGRCSMSSVIDMTEEDPERDPFAGPRIEVPEDEMRAIARPAIVLGRAKHRLDELATRLTYGRRH